MGGEPLGLVLIDDNLSMVVFDRVEGCHEQSLEPLKRIGLGVDDELIAGEEPVEKTAQHLIDHLLLGGEVVVETARQNPGGVGDVAHRGGSQTSFGEHRGREVQQLLTAGCRRWGRRCHGCWLDTDITSPVR